MSNIYYLGENDSRTCISGPHSSLHITVISFITGTNFYLQYNLYDKYVTVYYQNKLQYLDIPFIPDQLYKSVIENTNNEEVVMPILKIIHDALYPICIRDDFTLEILEEVNFSVSSVKSARKI